MFNYAKLLFVICWICTLKRRTAARPLCKRINGDPQSYGRLCSDLASHNTAWFLSRSGPVLAAVYIVTQGQRLALTYLIIKMYSQAGLITGLALGIIVEHVFSNRIRQSLSAHYILEAYVVGFDKDLISRLYYN